MSPRSKIRFAAAGVVCIGLGAGWYVSRRSDDRPVDVATASGNPAGPTAISDGPEIPLAFAGAGDGRTYALALDQVCIKGHDGIETIAVLDPPADPATFRARIAALSTQGDVFPIAYLEGQPRSEISRRLITRQLRVKIPAGGEAGVAAANGLAVAERPDYAPNWVILEAADPLAALAVVDSVRASKDVASADVITGRKRFTRTMPNDTLINSQWHLSNATTSPTITHINVESAWDYSTIGGGVRGRGIRIGIVDDGLETAHADLSANVDTANDWDWNGPVGSPTYAGDADPNPVVGGTSGDNHGTNCAGIAGARGNNGLGVSGVAPESTLVGLRLIGSGADPSDSQEASAFAHRNDIIQVKSNSWGPADTPVNLEAPEGMARDALVTAVTSGRGGKGTVFVWAGGNGKSVGDNSNYDGYANSIYTIAVGAMNSNGVSSTFSEPGANVVVVAPSGGGGTSLTTTDRTGSLGKVSGDYYTLFSGTSAATPVVSGAVALMLEKNPNLGWRDVQEILIRSATKVSPSDAGWQTNGAGFSFNHQFGAGLVNATAAVTLANGWSNLPSQTSLVRTRSEALAIPENNAAGVSKTFSFTETSHRVEQVTVAVDIAHSDRGNLKITLVSPSGTESVLADVFTHTGSAANYSWTFSSVRHWGESAYGNWTVKVADLSSTGNTVGGTLNGVTLTLFGAAHDFPNLPPQVSAASLDASGQRFADETIAVASVDASDPEGSPVSFSYQWQYGTDGSAYADETGANAAALAPSAGHAGKLWRCRITPSDGEDEGTPFFTAAVNLLSRPEPIAKTGLPYEFACGLVLPYQGAVPAFRLGAGSVVPTGLSLDLVTGVFSGTVDPGAAPEEYPITIERYDAFGAVISQSFTLRVFAGTYAQWIGGFSVAKSEPAVDNDEDGIPNLVEYLLDLEPNEAETVQPVEFSADEASISITFRQSKIPTDAVLNAEWSTTLGSGSVWQSTGITTAILEEDGFSKLVKATLLIDPDDGKRFLRLKAEQLAP